MGADQKRLSLLLPLVLFMAGCEALFASGGGEIPLPFHYSITVEVEEVIVEDGRITKIQVRELESSQNPGQVVDLDQSDAQEFNRHSPVCVGDQFELRSGRASCRERV